MTEPVSAPRLRRQVSSSGARIYTVTLDAFPHLSANAFLVVIGPTDRPHYTALIDTGSSHPDSTSGLTAGLDTVRERWGEQWSWETLSRVVITHAHPDHVAGLPFVRRLTGAPVAAHRLASPVIEDPEAARDAAMRQVEDQLRWAGIGLAPADQPDYALRLRNRSRNLMLPEGVAVETRLGDGDRLDGELEVIYTPGHAGGQICLRLADVLLSADHLLPHNSPPLMPERWQPGAGLTHYLASLDRIDALTGVTVALGGHDGPMPDWRERIRQLRERYGDKLTALLEAADQPQTVQDLTLRLYPNLRQAQALLLLDQTGALTEYLVRQGRMTGHPDSNRGQLFQRVETPNKGEAGLRVSSGVG